MKTTVLLVADIEGCTDPGACNYFEAANVEDGSCDYCSCVNAPVIDGYSIELETVAVDGVPGMTTYRLYATMVNPTDVCPVWWARMASRPTSTRARPSTRTVRWCPDR